jgi:RHS repeat-associated protein
VQWSGSSPPDPTEWDTITYTYDPAGRRIKKNVVGSYIVKYVYDGGHVIAEYDDSGLLRKYIYGARVDEPVCMLDVADNNKAYYYHFDGLGSVVALSNSNGDSCQSYEYSAYGQVAASDPNHPNPYMFTGRRFDIETGLYYYRARYYNPHIGRFMQADPVGYGAGMNWYLYCKNNPLAFVDPSGLLDTSFAIPSYIITRSPSDNEETALEQTKAFFDFFAAFCPDGKLYPEWVVNSVEICDDSYLVWFFTPDSCDVDIPSFDLLDVEVLKDTTYYDRTVVDKLQLLQIDDQTLVNDRLMLRIMEPAIEEVHGWSLEVSGKERRHNLRVEWDSWFWNRSESFRYGTRTYGGAQINYRVGGHAFKHYGYTWEAAKRRVFWWKRFRYGRKPSDPGMSETLYWFNRGYFEYPGAP